MADPSSAYNSLGLPIAEGRVHTHTHEVEGLRNQVEGIKNPDDLPEPLPFCKFIAELAGTKKDLIIDDIYGGDAGSSRFSAWYRRIINTISDIAGCSGSVILQLSDDDHASLQEHGRLAAEAPAGAQGARTDILAKPTSPPAPRRRWQRS